MKRMAISKEGEKHTSDKSIAPGTWCPTMSAATEVLGAVWSLKSKAIKRDQGIENLYWKRRNESDIKYEKISRDQTFASVSV